MIVETGMDIVGIDRIERLRRMNLLKLVPTQGKKGGDIMDYDRRTFLKQVGVGGAAVVGSKLAMRTAQAGTMGAGKGAKPADPAMPRRMTLLTMRSGEDYTLGVKMEKGILDVRKAAKALKSEAPITIDDLFRRGDQGLTELVEKALSSGKGVFVEESQIEFGPCVTNPEKIICVGLNYAKHARETNNPIPKLPILFNKYNNTLNCHQGTIRVSSIPGHQFDYEGELVVVMGRRAANVSEAEALSSVFGYCNGNDFSVRDLQMRSSQWMIRKTSDGCAPIGPYLVTADQVPNPNNLKIECTVNGEVRQSSNTNDMVFNCAQIVSYTSKLMTLEPGDIIFTGTPEGVIIGYPKEKQVWLKPGDKLTVKIEKLGELRFSLT
jgi:2-keto-4-pentenoate hydratase/2-oxohepta-3-ene-1,7-dioic acid hydratase in catechol pathway